MNLTRYEFGPDTIPYFETAKRKAKSRVKNILPVGWTYTIRSNEHLGYTNLLSSPVHVKRWVLEFHFYQDHLDVQVFFLTYRENFSVDRYNYTVRGNGSYKDVLPPSVEFLKTVFSSIDQLKKCATEILSVMDPSSFTQGES